MKQENKEAVEVLEHELKKLFEYSEELRNMISKHRSQLKTYETNLEICVKKAQSMNLVIDKLVMEDL